MTNWSQKTTRNRLATLICGLVIVVGGHQFTRQLWGQSPESSANSPKAPGTEPQAEGDPKTSSAKSPAGDPKKPPQWDQQQVNAGQAAFDSHCTQCHDANKSLGTSKSLHSWRSTIKRMAAQDGADIPTSDWEPIAVYLASLSSTNTPPAAGDSASTRLEEDSEPDVQVFGTVSPTFRSGPAGVQDPGFFPDVWLGVNWQPKGALSAKVTSCISCHEEAAEGFLSRVELVQASMRLDLGMLMREKQVCPALNQVEASVEAGRFVVPFGAFASQVNPGVYRTVSRPLIFNMGQRVFDEELGYPVLPMPYSDEGANFTFSTPLFGDVTAGMDGYVVNGLQGDATGINFDNSRNYTDNNRSPAVGGRWTVGNGMFKLGSSLMTGRFNGSGGTGPLNQGLNYTLLGADATYRYKDIFRVQAEYAQRNTDSFIDQPGRPFGTDRVGGGYVEGELWLFDELSLLCRWDLQRQHYAALPVGSPLPSDRFEVQRWTYGINWAVTGNSLLMFNVEHWALPGGFKDINVVGFRWSASF